MTVAAILTPASKADTIELLNGDLLTGKITGMSKTGAIIESSISVNPLKIQAQAIKKITFPSDLNDTKSHSERITLTNGDVLPCRVVSMDQEMLKISTWYAGEFNINRKHIRSLRFGLSQERNIYTGGDPISDWSSKQGRWTLKDFTYSSRDPGTLARELKAPNNFRVSFDLLWKDTPNFAFRFCAESDASTTKQDTYELTFNSAGMKLVRYQDRHQTAPLGNIDLKPSDLENKKIHFDFRINRSEGSVTLYLNGNKVDTWHDLLPTAEGNYIIFNNRSNQASACIISNIHVTQWQDSRHLAKIEPTSTDVLIDNQGDKISGKLLKISENLNKQRTIQLKGKHSPKPLIVPDYRVSILYFSEEENSSEIPQAVFRANLNSHGTMQLEQPKLEQNKIMTRHPILGLCKLDPTVINSITQSSAPTED